MSDGPSLLDLDPDSRDALEFPRVLDAVAALAVTAVGKDGVLHLAPLADPEAIEAEHAAVDEVRRHLLDTGRLIPGGVPDPRAALQALSVEGLSVDPSALRSLAIVLSVASELRTALLRLPAEDWPHLRQLGTEMADLRREAAEIVGGIDPDGRLTDGASPDLRRIRAASARIGERLRRMLESIVREPGADSIIRDDFVTQRNGRFVVPVRADAPRALRGIVHAASSSGATLFVEPLESVELNNELVRLAEQESVEQGRILDVWARRLRERLEEVENAVRGLARGDSLQARARFAVDAGAIRPSIGPALRLALVDARHPLLDAALRLSGQRAVPSTVVVDPPDRVLVVSGPNAGGKTVVLKTIGLATLMAHAGIPVLAAEASLPFLFQLRADIGDHQSIQASLSTFSAHVRAVVRFVREARTPALFLFDEIGTGTEPTEGGALAQAILERLMRPGQTVVATTHQSALKAWAFRTPGAVSAALEFDEERLVPTYRVLMGAAGVSAGLEIAERLGLEGEVVERARRLIGTEGRQSEALLARLRELTAEIEERRDRLAEGEKALVEERHRIESRAEHDRIALRRSAAEALEQSLRELRDAVQREIAAIRDQRERARAEKDWFRTEVRLRQEAARRAPRGTTPEPALTGPPATIDRGSAVRILSLDREGVVARIRGDRVDVTMGNATFTVRREDVAAIGGKTAAPMRGDEGRGPSPRTARGPGLEDDVPREIVLIGRTVDEAIPELDRFLDGCALAGRSEVRVVHGHGTGRLRAAIRRFLTGHPHVESHRPGDPTEGGDGATVVRLR